MPELDSFTAASLQMDRDLITFARQLAGAHQQDGLRTLIAAVPGHEAMADIPDEDVYAYASGVMAEVMKTLANLAERELGRNA